MDYKNILCSFRTAQSKKHFKQCFLLCDWHPLGVLFCCGKKGGII
nr:MAG TPA: hypothetical protein [Caudoviricetes sp.]